MKKLLRIIYVAFLLACLCSSATAKQIYFQYTDGADWWGNDGAKIGAIFREGMSDQDYGVYTSFFTPVAGLPCREIQSALILDTTPFCVTTIISLFSSTIVKATSLDDDDLNLVAIKPIPPLF